MPNNIFVVVSVDWEGRSLLPENLQLMARFRRKHPDVPMQHFLNAAYYTRTGIDAAKTTEAIASTLLPDDDHGLHVHAWHSLLAAADVEGRTTPVYGRTNAPRDADDREFYPAESGYDVPLHHFEVGELQSMIDTSASILTANGFQRPRSFRAGGWMAGERVHTALTHCGFQADCSAAPPHYAIARFGAELPLCRWLQELWATTHETSQPYLMTMRAGELWQVPNNASLADYTTTEEIVGIFERNLASWRQSAANRDWYFSTGFHQETARKYLHRLDQAIDIIKQIAARERLPLKFTAKPQAHLNDRN